MLPRATRQAHLQTLRTSFAGMAADLAAVAASCRPHQGSRAEAELLERLPEALARLGRLPPPDREAVQTVLDTLTRGMLFDLETFPGEDRAHLAALTTMEDLDRYTYMAAGCVGEFWTKIHVAHRPRLRGWDIAAMAAHGVRFGKALQLTNVLRDLPRDLEHGRCYLPADALAAHGLAPADLLKTDTFDRVRPTYEALLDRAADHYRVGWAYTLAIPRAEWRMRLACAWPLLIGEATIAALRRHPNPLAATPPVKIPRARVRAIVARSTLTVWSNGALTAQADRLRDPTAA